MSAAPDILFPRRDEDLRRKGSQRGHLVKRGNSWIVNYSRWSRNAAGNLTYGPTSAKVGECTGKNRITKVEARAKADAVVADANKDSAVPQGRATFKQFVDARFNPEHVAQMRPNGKAHYEYLLRVHVLPSLADVQLKDVSRALVQEIVAAKLDAGLSPQTVVHIRNVISAVMGHAKKLGFHSGDLPTELVEIRMRRVKQQRALTWPQVEAIAAEIGLYRPLVLLLASTGLRIGEALGLRWKFVNLSSEWRVVDHLAIPPQSVAVVQSYNRGEWGPPKTEAGARKVPLTSTAWVAMAEWAECHHEASPDDPVFAGSTGNPWDAHNVAKRHLKPAGKKAGCPWVHWHAFRHTTATLADMAGMSPAAKQKVLGHATAAMGMNYTHPDLETVRQQLEKTDGKGRVN